jgi:hypothetical protein
MHVEETGRWKSHVSRVFHDWEARASAWYSVKAVALTPPVSLPPACTECTSTLQSAKPGSLPQKISYKMSRSADGKMRVDYGNTSVITNPATGQTVLLDHVKKEVRTIQAPAAKLPQPGAPQLKVPGMPGAPTPPALSATTVKDLGKRVIEGQEVEGKQYTLPPIAPPKLPAAPQAPAIPGMPGAPTPPQIPPLQPKALVSEVWTSTKLQMPVLTRITGSFGQQMCHCKNTVAGEPHPSTFQIPADYKQVGLPPAPKPPAAPAPPAMPAAPAMPKPPSLG